MADFSNVSRNQRGMTLLVALVTLVVLMLLGMSAMNTSKTMFKLAGNLQFENEAKNRAESALNKAEGWLMTGTNSANPGFSAAAAPYYGPTAVVDPLNAWPAAALAVAANEEYIIQRINAGKISGLGNSLGLGGQITTAPQNLDLYRITARGRSARGATRYVESIVQIPD